MIDRYGDSVSIDDAAKIVDCHPDTLRKLVNEHLIPFFTLRGRIKFFVPDLIQWMREGGEAQYEPAPRMPTTGSVRPLRPRRRSDVPAWMRKAMATSEA